MTVARGDPRQRLLQQLLRGEAPSDPAPEDAADNFAPASFQQEQMWLIGRLTPDDPSYNFPSAYRLRGELDVAELEKSIGMLFARHAILRTVLRRVGGSLIQVAIDHVPVVTRHDVSSFGRSALDEAYAVIKRNASQTFALEADVPLRVHLLALGPHDHILVFIAHHAAVDLWSQELLIRELARTYERILRGEHFDVTPEFEYMQYSRKQRAFAEDGGFTTDLDYWNRLLSPTLEPLQLPLRTLRGDVNAEEGGVDDVVLSAELSYRIAQLCRREHCSPFIVVIATWLAVFARCSGQRSLLAAFVTSQRGDERFESTIGSFIGTTPLRIDFDGESGFTDLVRSVHDNLLEGQSHCQIPLQMLVEKVAALRGADNLPFLNVLFNSYLGIVAAPKPIEHLEVTRLEQRRPFTRFPLQIYAIDSPHGLRIRVIYQARLFEQESIGLLLDRCVQLLDATVEREDRALFSYDLDGAHDAAVRAPVGNALTAIPDVIDLFLEQMRQNPSSVAIECNGRSWTYAALGERAREICAALLEEGLVCGDIVGIECDKGFDLYAAALGALMARGVLLMLDRTLPANRRQQMCEAAFPRFMWRAGDGEGGGSVHRTEYRSARTMPSDLGYVMFSSGSTGAPRGVLGRRSALSHFVAWQIGRWDIGSGDRFAQFTSSSFDVFLRDMFTPLCSGATLCTPSNRDDALGWVASQRITRLHAVASLMTTWLHAEPTAELSCVKTIFFAGEPLTRSVIESCRRRTGDETAFVNLYGTTEATLATCYYEVPARPADEPIPVGRSRPSFEIAVINQAGVRASIGEIGEVWISSALLSHGYLDDAADVRFVDAPGYPPGRTRAFRTRDVGRIRADGDLELLGRLDGEIKIAGVRVNPTAVAHVVGGHPDVRAAAVFVIPSPGGEPVLSAAIASERTDHDALIREVVKVAERTLFGPAIPRRYVVADHLPTTRHGKVDIAAVSLWPAVVAQPTELGSTMTDTEQKLANLWFRLLDVRATTPKDDFFDLGGYSLIAIRIIGDIEETFGVRLSLRMIFDLPMLGDLASAIDRAMA